MRMYTRRIIKAKLTAPQIDPTHAPKQNPSAESDSFYYKLNQLWDSFGLGLIINARNTSLDLFLFYSEVTRRGGYHQVSRDRKWDELVSALKLEGNSPKLSVQLEKCYGLLLYQYELLYYYRDPAVKASANSNSLGLLTKCISPERKRKYEVCLFELTGSEDNEEEDEEEAEMCTEMSGSVVVEPKMVVQASPDDKKVKKRGGKSPRPRTAYQIFIKEECARLRSCNLASPRTNILYMAIDAWRSMTEVEKQPYVDESMKEKGRLMEAGKSLQLDVESGSDGLELVMSKEKPRGIHTKW